MPEQCLEFSQAAAILGLTVAAQRLSFCIPAPVGEVRKSTTHLFVELPDGTKLWDDGAKLRRAIGRFGKLETADGIKGVECGLADELLATLRDAMKQARGKVS